MAKRTGTKLRIHPALFMLPLALLFAAVGIVATRLSSKSLAEADAMRSWVEVPATIVQADLKTETRFDHGYRGRDRPPGSRIKHTHTLIAAYEYKFNGTPFIGNRVSIYGNSSTGGSHSPFLHSAHWTLRQHQASGKPFRCFVNPQQPGESVLFREVRWQMTAGYTLFATLFGAIGFGMLTGFLFAAALRLRTRTTKRSSVALPVLAVLAVWWTIASFPLVTRLPEIFTSAESPFVVVTLVFPAVGALLWIATVDQILRRFTRRSGSA